MRKKLYQVETCYYLRANFFTRWPILQKLKMQIWDISGRKFTDMSLMGVGTNILGYSNKRIDDAVVNSLRRKPYL